MLYNLADAFQAKQAETYFAKLQTDGALIELSKKKRQRTIPQNSYLHLILSYFASEYGETLDYVKRAYFKVACNKELFFFEAYDAILGKNVIRLKSSRDLTSAEMTEAIERFRTWSSQKAGIYLPAPNETEFLAAAEATVRRNQRFI